MSAVATTVWMASIVDFPLRNFGHVSRGIAGPLILAIATLYASPHGYSFASRTQLYEARFLAPRDLSLRRAFAARSTTLRASLAPSVLVLCIRLLAFKHFSGDRGSPYSTNTCRATSLVRLDLPWHDCVACSYQRCRLLLGPQIRSRIFSSESFDEELLVELLRLPHSIARLPSCQCISRSAPEARSPPFGKFVPSCSCTPPYPRSSCCLQLVNDTAQKGELHRFSTPIRQLLCCVAVVEV